MFPSCFLFAVVFACLSCCCCCCPCQSLLEHRLASFEDDMKFATGVSLFGPILSGVFLEEKPNFLSLPKISTSAVKACYDGELNGTHIPLFSPNATVFQVLLTYYKSLPSKKVTRESIENLLLASRAITQHVVACSVKQRTYKLGFTNISDKSPKEFRKLLAGYNDGRGSSGTALPLPSETNSTGSLGRIVSGCLSPSTFRPPASLNWTSLGVVTGVRHQYQCASCWAFAVTASLESAYLRYHRKRLDLSEQQLVDCSLPSWTGGESGRECQTGTAYMALRYIYYNGLASEKSWPYRAAFQGCPVAPPKWQAALRTFCIRGLNDYGSNNAYTSWERLTETEMVRSVAFFGPVTVALNSDLLQHYKGGVFDPPEGCPRRLTHMVLLVGYTSQAWILKNSWGVRWGERGYFRLARGKNLCNVNYEISYPLV